MIVTGIIIPTKHAKPKFMSIAMDIAIASIILSNQKGSTLDPSRSEDGLTSKIGMDASLPPGIDKSPYESVLWG